MRNRHGPGGARLLRAALIGVALGATTGAHAGRPFSTEDAGVLERGSCEVEAFAEAVRDAPTARAASAQFGCGVGARTQLSAAFAQGRIAGERPRALVLAGKTRLVDGGAVQPSLTLAYSYTHDRPDGASWQRGAVGATGVVTVPARGWLVHANVGAVAERDPSRTVTVWALAFERPAAFGSIDAGFELFGDDRSTRWVQVAARWNFRPETLLFDASIGRQTGGGSADRVTVGLKWVL